PPGPARLDLLLEVLLHRVQQARPAVLAVRQVAEAVGVAVDADELLDLLVPGSEIRVRDRPVLPGSVELGSLEVVVGHPLQHTPIGMQATSELAAADPQE